jgi:hypothetical protein
MAVLTASGELLMGGKGDAPKWTYRKKSRAANPGLGFLTRFSWRLCPCPLASPPYLFRTAYTRSDWIDHAGASATLSRRLIRTNFA